MSFMKMVTYAKGALYCADCSKCGVTHYAHEWTTDAFNEERDAMEAGTLRCPECGGKIDASTFIKCKRSYAGMIFALVGRRGDYGLRYVLSDISKLYAKGVYLANAGDMLRVHRVAIDGTISSYDSARTQRLTDKIVASRKPLNKEQS